MVARINREMFAHASRTPDQHPSDSDGVRMALETARALEAQGDILEAARWIRRGADEAEKNGKNERVLALARAAADLANDAASATQSGAAPSSVPTLNVRGRGSFRATRAESAANSPANSAPSRAAPRPQQSGSIPPLLAALVSSVPPFSGRASSPSTRPTSSSPLPSTPPPSAPAPMPASLSHPSEKQITDRRMRIGAIRVAITASSSDAKSFSVERLEPGQASPPGTMEAMLVLTGEIDGSLEMETHLRVTEGSAPKR
jgi:hypothetical protein